MKSHSEEQGAIETGLWELMRGHLFGLTAWCWQLLPCGFLVLGGSILSKRSSFGELDSTGLGIGWITLGLVSLLAQRLRLRWMFQRMDASRGGKQLAEGVSVNGRGGA